MTKPPALKWTRLAPDHWQTQTFKSTTAEYRSRYEIWRFQGWTVERVARKTGKEFTRYLNHLRIPERQDLSNPPTLITLQDAKALARADHERQHSM